MPLVRKSSMRRPEGSKACIASMGLPASSLSIALRYPDVHVGAEPLQALGMSMISPTTISLPFKLLLFVMLDGWTRLVHGLVLSYR